MGLEPTTSTLRVRRAKHCATLPVNPLLRNPAYNDSVDVVLQNYPNKVVIKYCISLKDVWVFYFHFRCVDINTS